MQKLLFVFIILSVSITACKSRKQRSIECLSLYYAKLRQLSEKSKKYRALNDRAMDRIIAHPHDSLTKVLSYDSLILSGEAYCKVLDSFMIDLKKIDLASDTTKLIDNTIKEISRLKTYNSEDCKSRWIFEKQNIGKDDVDDKKFDDAMMDIVRVKSQLTDYQAAFINEYQIDDDVVEELITKEIH